MIVEARRMLPNGYRILFGPALGLIPMGYEMDNLVTKLSLGGRLQDIRWRHAADHTE